MKIMTIVLSIVSSITFFTIHPCDFIDSTLAEFNIRLVNETDRDEFTAYYCEFIQKLKKMSSANKKKELDLLHSKALCSLEIKHPEWAKQIKPLSISKESSPENRDRVLAQRFLTRYGLHEEFVKIHACKTVSVWNRVKNYSNHMSSKVARWLHIKRDTIIT